MGVHIPKREGAIFGGCPGHSDLVLPSLRRRRRSVRCKRDHSIANNVMQQKGSFSVPGKRK